MKNKIKKALLICIAITAIFCMSGCKKKNQFVVGFDANFPPYGSMDEETGEYVGFDLDLAKEVCKRNGWEFVPQPIKWSAKDFELNSGSISCIWNGFTINGREDAYTWSKAYVDNSQVIVVSAKSDIYTLEDLEDKIVVVQTDSSAYKAFKGDDATEENKKLLESFKKLEPIDNYTTAFMYLDSNTVQAICMDVGAAKYNVGKFDGKYRILDEVISSELYGIGFKLGDTELRNQVQATLDEMYEDGTFMEIADKWGLADSVCLGEEGTYDAYNLDAKGDKRASNKKSLLEDCIDTLKQMPKGILATFVIFFATLAISLPLGLLVCAVRMCKIKIFRMITSVYISIMRGTPLMLQLFVVFFGPYYVFGLDVPYEFRIVAIIIGFSLNYAAYFAEIFRGGIQSIPVGQHEAASVLGFSRIQTYWKITFPQMVKRVIPSVTNEIITLVKDTSLAMVLSYVEMFTIAQEIAATKCSIVPLFIAGAFYYVFNVIIAFVMSRIEKKLNYYS